MQNIDQNGDNVFYKGKYKLTIGACSPWNKSSSFGLDHIESFFNIN